MDWRLWLGKFGQKKTNTPTCDVTHR